MGIVNLRGYLTKASSPHDAQKIQASAITSTDAKITWESAVENQGLVRYSTDPSAFTQTDSSALLFSVEAKPATNHEVKLTMLKPGQTYYYKVIVGEKVYDNANLPYTFNTLTSDAALGPNSLPTLDKNIFKQKFGTSDPLYDLNNDGVVNSKDYLLYLQRTGETN
jgi:hypothetical protein